MNDSQTIDWTGSPKFRVLTGSELTAVSGGGTGGAYDGPGSRGEGVGGSRGGSAGNDNDRGRENGCRTERKERKVSAGAKINTPWGEFGTEVTGNASSEKTTCGGRDNNGKD